MRQPSVPIHKDRFKCLGNIPKTATLRSWPSVYANYFLPRSPGVEPAFRLRNAAPRLAPPLRPTSFFGIVKVASRWRATAGRHLDSVVAQVQNAQRAARPDPCDPRDPVVAHVERLEARG